MMMMNVWTKKRKAHCDTRGEVKETVIFFFSAKLSANPNLVEEEEVQLNETTISFNSAVIWRNFAFHHFMQSRLNHRICLEGFEWFWTLDQKTADHYSCWDSSSEDHECTQCCTIPSSRWISGHFELLVVPEESSNDQSTVVSSSGDHECLRI